MYISHNHGEPIQKESTNITKEQLARLKELFPEISTEDKVDFDRLRATLGDLVDDGPERYSFTWAGKRDAIRLLQTPTRATLVPCREESVDFDSTKHLFIEGDNLEVLKLLYKPYFGRVKMIYIDPPYNTGNDFIYPDNYADPLATYLQLTGQQDAKGNLLTSNPETSGRYHSTWLSMMYPRLFLARQLLREDGVIFVSIDDHEVHNLRLLMNEVFGEENFVATAVWQKVFARKNKALVSDSHDYIVIYTKSISSWQRNLLPRSEGQLEVFKNPDNDPRGPWQSVSFSVQSEDAEKRKAYRYPIRLPSGEEVLPPPGRHWNGLPERYEQLKKEGRLWFGPDRDRLPRLKVYLQEVQRGIVPDTWWSYNEVGHNQEAKKEILELFPDEEPFSTPKPTRLTHRMLQIATNPDTADIVLDFFAGSASTAHAVLGLNHQDGGNRRFIMVQLPEPTDNAQLPTIADIGKERIRRVISKMKSKKQLSLGSRKTQEDLGFKVFKLAPSNYRPWTGVEEATPNAYAEQMKLFFDPLVEGWTTENVIYEVGLKEGYGLNCRIELLPAISSNTIYCVTDPDKEQSFTICLDDTIHPKTIRALDLSKDDLLICRDLALDDEAAANLALQCRLKTI